jgi:inorganic pyrophosphatase
MKYIISEDQNERMINLIVKTGERFVSESVVKTELFVEHNYDLGYYVIYPTFYVDKDKVDVFVFFYQNELADYIENYLGVPIKVGTVKVKWA